MDTVVDPGEYPVKVLGLPLVRAGRYVHVPLTVMFDGEEIGVLNELFDIRQPRS